MKIKTIKNQSDKRSYSEGIMKLAKEWLNTDGRIKTLSKSTVTEDRQGLPELVNLF